MLLLFGVLSQAFLFGLPILILPLLLAIDYFLMLRFSVIFCFYHFILGTIKLITKKTLVFYLEVLPG